MGFRLSFCDYSVNAAVLKKNPTQTTKIPVVLAPMLLTLVEENTQVKSNWVVLVYVKLRSLSVMTSCSYSLAPTSLLGNNKTHTLLINIVLIAN